MTAQIHPDTIAVLRRAICDSYRYGIGAAITELDNATTMAAWTDHEIAVIRWCAQRLRELSIAAGQDTP